MIELHIKEPKIEKFFNHSKDEILKALDFIVENNINEFKKNDENTELSKSQKEELLSREGSFHKNPLDTLSWDEVKKDLSHS